jgi:hypothetical protein
MFGDDEENSGVSFVGFLFALQQYLFWGGY